MYKNKYQTIRLNLSLLSELSQLNLESLFTTIYQQGFWGTDEKSHFYSGSGSHEEKLILPYIKKVRQFLSSFETPPVVVDLGCGDFKIGQQLVDLCSIYHGCDIVADLINHNRTQFKLDGLVFSCIDATRDDLPKGDILIVRQVFQHLSNEAIAMILQQSNKFSYIIVTEHLPEGGFTANIDKSSGPDSRLRFNSGVDITAPPFSLQPDKQQILCTVSDTKDFPGIITTTLYQM